MPELTRSEKDIVFMQQALKLAEQGALAGEVPVAALVVVGDEVVAKAFNQPITLSDPSAHAEILVLRQAGKILKNYRLTNASLYVTLEPCLMCLGAMVHARIKRLVFAATDKKTGVLGGCDCLYKSPSINHQFEISSGVLAQQSSALLRAFFQKKR